MYVAHVWGTVVYAVCDNYTLAWTQAPQTGTQHGCYICTHTHTFSGRGDSTQRQAVHRGSRSAAVGYTKLRIGRGVDAVGTIGYCTEAGVCSSQYALHRAMSM